MTPRQPPTRVCVCVCVCVRHYRSCGVESLLPEFSGSVVSGQYATYKFSFAECKARHAALHARLVEVRQACAHTDARARAPPDIG